jgi:hypothetical protein
VYRALAVLITLLLSGCSQDASSSGGSLSAMSSTSTVAAQEYAAPRKIAVLDDKRIKESSGLCRSLANPDCFWTHNDKGGGPRLYLINRQGETVAAPKIDGAETKDWEDLSSYSRGGKNYLLIADTGDNEGTRRSYRLYIVEEPSLREQKKKLKDVDLSMEIQFRYADARRDCEAVAVDSTSGAVYLVTKEKKRGAVVYQLPLPEKESTSTLVAEAIARLDLPTVVAMDISPDGRRAVVLSDEANAYEYSRKGDQTWEAAFEATPVTLKMPPRKQGESICYGADGRTLYLTSEGERQPLWEVPVQ